MIIVMNRTNKSFMDHISDSICSAQDVKSTFVLAEKLAVIDGGRLLSLDYLVSAILFYYDEVFPNSLVIKLFPAKDYYAQVIKDSAPEISFVNLTNEAPQFGLNYYTPDIQTTLFNRILTIKTTLTVPLLLFTICDICEKENLTRPPILCKDKKKFEQLYTHLSKSCVYMYAYKNKLDIPSGTDITFKAARNEYDKIIGRTEEINHILRILCKKTKNNPLLVGEPGVGKTHIVEALAKLFTQGQVPKKLLGKKIISLNVTELVSGTKYRGDFEEKVKNFLEKIYSNDAIIFIDEIHAICYNVSTDSNTLGEMLKPYLLDPNYCIIGTTTLKEYRRIEKDPALARRFDVVYISEPSVPETIEILRGLKTNYEKFHSITITNKVIEQCVKLADRYISASNFPDKAIDLLDEACAKKECDRKNGKNLLSVNDLYAVITEKTGISLLSSEKKDIFKLEKTLKAKIIGQDYAISEIIRALKRSALDLQDANRPIASFLFAGTTGVGKTETAKVLANEYFEDPKALVRFDMSEYQTQETVQRLTGSAPGYVGYNEGGQLTNAVKNRPYCVVLFDEIEKAHPDVLNILLQILDDGRLTDNSGITVNFKNTIIILTTNIGAKSVQTQSLGFGSATPADNEKTVISEIKKTLRPELINRLSNIVVYNQLTTDDCEKIVDIYLAKFQKKLHARGIRFFYSENLSHSLVQKGYDKTYGARELRRLFEKIIVDKVVDLILSTNTTNILIDSDFNVSI